MLSLPLLTCLSGSFALKKQPGIISEKTERFLSAQQIIGILR